MSNLKILYFHGKEPYQFKDDAERAEVHKIGENIQRKLAHFTEAINAENGHVTVFVTPTARRDTYKNFNFHVEIEGVSAPLKAKFQKSGALS